MNSSIITNNIENIDKNKNIVGIRTEQFDAVKK